MERIIREYGYLAIAAIAITVFWEPLNELFVSVLLPLVAKVAKNSWYIQIGIMILPLLFYFPHFFVQHRRNPMRSRPFVVNNPALKGGALWSKSGALRHIRAVYSARRLPEKAGKACKISTRIQVGVGKPATNRTGKTMPFTMPFISANRTGAGGVCGIHIHHPQTASLGLVLHKRTRSRGGRQAFHHITY